jgi:hypothetical protein
MTTTDLAHVIVTPDSLPAKEPTEILRERCNDLLFNFRHECRATRIPRAGDMT